MIVVAKGSFAVDFQISERMVVFDGLVLLGQFLENRRFCPLLKEHHLGSEIGNLSSFVDTLAHK